MATATPTPSSVMPQHINEPAALHTHSKGKWFAVPERTVFTDVRTERPALDPRIELKKIKSPEILKLVRAQLKGTPESRK